MKVIHQMILGGGLVLGLTSCQTTGKAKDTGIIWCAADTKSTNEANLSKIINAPNSILVDVRTPEEFAEGSANGAINIPLDQLENHLDKLNSSQDIVLFCRSGRRSEEAKTILEKHGFKKVYNAGTWNEVKALQKETK
ncbi:rhodanese-like domain-containing protein [Riemerella anatipestifer]|uniref:rhodanese-like domain-containing protein n=1 Tax=Riemerella anatipestifer TaxID=34085 RepID=UPI0012AEACC1|nr:rhodanese-like domain-containing protein [Riemerella anatipestifer]USL95922.1 rhodanese-like domain-containing protein [Riemerella anatipestifer]